MAKPNSSLAEPADVHPARNDGLDHPAATWSSGGHRRASADRAGPVRRGASRAAGSPRARHASVIDGDSRSPPMITRLVERASVARHASTTRTSLHRVEPPMLTTSGQPPSASGEPGQRGQEAVDGGAQIAQWTLAHPRRACPIPAAWKPSGTTVARPPNRPCRVARPVRGGDREGGAPRGRPGRSAARPCGPEPPVLADVTVAELLPREHPVRVHCRDHTVRVGGRREHDRNSGPSGDACAASVPTSAIRTCRTSSPGSERSTRRMPRSMATR